VRVHLHSKRWPVAHTVDWRQRVVHLAEEYLVVDKPSGVQCTPSEDNVLECLPACVERVRSWRPKDFECPRLRNGGVYRPPSRPAGNSLWWGSVRCAKALTIALPLTQALGLEVGALKPTHRLDEGTEGLVVVARTADFASYFQSLMKLNKHEELVISKQYRCLSFCAPPLGKLEHRLRIGVRFRGSPKYSAVLRGSVRSRPPMGFWSWVTVSSVRMSSECSLTRPLTSGMNSGHLTSGMNPGHLTSSMDRAIAAGGG
jgi:16S rRNA U516 pseudouridylate synthase RsuA-like enzyme